MPPTANIKMIDVWLIFNLALPFMLILLHTYMEFQRNQEDAKKAEEEEKHKHHRRHRHHRFVNVDNHK